MYLKGLRRGDFYCYVFAEHTWVYWMISIYDHSPTTQTHTSQIFALDFYLWLDTSFGGDWPLHFAVSCFICYCARRAQTLVQHHTTFSLSFHPVLDTRMIKGWRTLLWPTLMSGLRMLCTYVRIYISLFWAWARKKNHSCLVLLFLHNYYYHRLYLYIMKTIIINLTLV
jgi:hypothetical protein